MALSALLLAGATSASENSNYSFERWDTSALVGTGYAVSFFTGPLCISDNGSIGTDVFASPPNPSLPAGSAIFGHEDVEIFAPSGIKCLNASGEAGGSGFQLFNGVNTEVAWLRDQSGSVEFFIPPGSTAAAARGISNNGIVVGSARVNNKLLGFVRDADGYQFIGANLTAAAIRLYGVNSSRQMVGQLTTGNSRGLFIDRDGTEEIFMVPSSYSTEPTCINNRGDIAGAARFVLNGLPYTPGFVRRGGEYETFSVESNLPPTITMTDGRVFALAANRTSHAVFGINTRGDIVFRSSSLYFLVGGNSALLSINHWVGTRH